MQYIQQNFRYLGDWRTSGRGLVPFSLAEIDQHGYGDCKDLATLVTAMLRTSGVKAEPVWLKRGTFAPPLLVADIYEPDHAIVRAEVDGEVWWLDPTNTAFAPGRIMPDILQRWALVIGADGRLRQDAAPLEEPVVAVDAKVRRHLTNGEKGDVDAALAIRAGALMQIADSDRGNGKSSTDKSICDLFANESGRCNVQRDATGFVMPAQYDTKVQVVDLRALDKSSGKYMFRPAGLNDIWDGLARKTAWISHDEIVSAEFQKIVQQNRDCVETLHFPFQPQKS